MSTCFGKFKAPRKIDDKAGQEKIEIDEDDSLSTTDELSMEEDSFKEAIFREEVAQWLALNGKALFALETSRFLAKERKSHSVKPTLSRTRGNVTPLEIGE